ncbi:MAG: hypothetical protein JNJ77_17445, partial [Planctomycetia bacterium]|nr:hypothetical protein [Planctomycetia bacterium]
KYAWSFDAGATWLGNIAVTPTFNHMLGFPSQNKLGDYYDMSSDDNGANVVFSATFNGGQDVYFMRITAVPEPTTVGFVIVISGTTLMWVRRQKLKQKADHNRSIIEE